MNLDYYRNQSNIERGNVVISIGNHTKDISPHNHQYTELTVVLEGTAVHEVEGCEFPVSQGSVHTVPPEMIHRYSHVQNLQLCDFVISVPTLLQYNSAFGLIPGFHEFFFQSGTKPELHRFNQFHIKSKEDFNFIRELCCRIFNECHSRPAGFEVVSSNYFNGLLSCLLRLFPGASTPTGSYRLHNAIKYMNEHYTEKISVKYLSELTNLSERQFYRLFQATYDFTPTQYIIQLRLAHASRLLTATELPLSVIAIQSGFPDPAIFSRQFSQHYHVTPRKFRQQARADSHGAVHTT